MKHSAGLLLYRRRGGAIEVLLVHPGGPFWAKKDEHAWSMPKGELGPGEDALAAARREFFEETGFAPQGAAHDLGAVKSSAKVIHAWAVPGDWDPAGLRSNPFSMEWPPRSGRVASFPEVDRAAWFGLDEARVKIHKNQLAFIDALERALAGPG
ncbi:MAG: NUDIX domain-containing protein [Gemmatimonas sp.]